MNRLLCFLVVIAAIGIQTVAAGPIRISVKDTTVLRGSMFLYAVAIDSSVTDSNVTSYELELNYDGSAFHVDSVITTGTMSSDWLLTPNITGSHIVVAGAGTQPLIGTGVLFYFKLTAPLSSGAWGSSFQFTRSMLNEGTPATTTRSGTVWISNLPVITVYPNEALLTVGETAQFYVSGGSAPYQWSTTNPAVAAIDTNGKLTGLQAGTCRVAVRDNGGIVDTSGTIEVRAFKVIVRDTSLLQGQTINVPIYVTDLSQVDVTAGQFTITYNRDLLTYMGFDKAGALLEPYSSVTVSAISNQLNVSFAGTARLNGVGTQILLWLRFKASVLYTGGAWLNFSNLLFNENILGTIDDGVVYVNNRIVLGLTPNSGNILVSDTVQFAITGTPRGPVVWRSTDSTVASVSQSGLLRALKSGVMQIVIEDSVGQMGVTQNIYVYDIRVSMRDSSVLTRDSIVLPIYITEYMPGFTSVQMLIRLDTNYIENASVITDGTLMDGQTVYSFARHETLSVAWGSATPMTGPGILWKIKFWARYSAPKLSTTRINLTNVLFNEGVPVPHVVSGNLFMRWERDVSVDNIFEPVGIINQDSTVTPRVRVRNVRDVAQTTIVRFRIGSLYADSIVAGLAPWQTMDLTFPRTFTATMPGTFVVRCEAALEKDQDTSNNVIVQNLAVVRTSSDPVIVSMAPNHGGNVGIVSSFIHGHNFRRGASVHLTQAGQPDFVVDSTYVRVLDSTKILVLFDFNYQPTGLWNIIVTNPDSGTTTFYDGFTVEEPAQKHLWVNIAGQNRIRMGREQSYTFSYGNIGNIDAIGVTLFIRGIPKNVQYKPDFILNSAPSSDSATWAPYPDFIETSTEKILPIFIPIVRANTTHQLSIRLMAPWGSARFTLQAGISDVDVHFYNPPPPPPPLALAGKTSMTVLGATDVNWDCVAAIGQLVMSVLEIFAPRECFNLAANTIVGVASVATEQDLKWSLIKFVASELKDAAFCAGYVLGAEIMLPIKVASVLTDLIASGADIYQKCFPDNQTQLPVQPVASMDPNHKAGTAGYDTTNHYTSRDKPLLYEIEFENLATATAEAETIVVHDTLDANVDWTTLQFEGSSHPSVLTTQLDESSRSILWRFGGINLPPNVNPPEGQGWALFSIMPKQNLPSGTQISNRASIVFDYNPPLVTNTFVNTIDSGKPDSHVETLPETTATGEFTVRWTGHDDPLGSGIRSYDIYVKYDTGSYIPWLIGTTDTMATFVGNNEKVQSFYSIAVDNVGQREDPPSTPDAVTYVNGVAAPVCTSPTNGTFSSDPTPTFTWTPTAGRLGHYALQYASDSAFTSNLVTITDIADTTYTLLDTIPDAQYFWRVEAISRSGSHSGYRAPFRLTIDTQSPAVPVLISLGDSAVVGDRTPAFAWTKTAGDDGRYFWECAIDPLFDSVRFAYYTSDTAFSIPDNFALKHGKYYWHVHAIDRARNNSPFQSQPFVFTVDTTLVGVLEGEGIPTQYTLYQNFPNPFNPLTTLKYGLPMSSRVKLTVYDVLGQVVAVPVDGIETAGVKAVHWNASRIASGVYFYRIEATSVSDRNKTFTDVKKMILLR